MTEMATSHSDRRREAFEFEVGAELIRTAERKHCRYVMRTNRRVGLVSLFSSFGSGIACSVDCRELSGVKAMYPSQQIKAPCNSVCVMNRCDMYPGR